MKDKTLLLLAALAGIAGLGWYLKTQADAKASGTTGSTLAAALEGTPPKTLLETLAGLIAANPASPVTPPSASDPVLTTTPAPTVSEPSLIDTYLPLVGKQPIVRRGGVTSVIPASHQPTPGFEPPDIIYG